MRIEVHGTEEECQTLLNVLNGAIGGNTNIVIEVETYVETPLIVAKPFVVIQGGRSVGVVPKSVELPRLP